MLQIPEHIDEAQNNHDLFDRSILRDVATVNRSCLQRFHGDKGSISNREVFVATKIDQIKPLHA